MNTTAVVMHRRLAEVSSWAEMKSACGSMTSGTVTLGDDFMMGSYDSQIDFSGKTLVIIGNNKVLNAGENGRFFYGSGTGSSLKVHSVTMTNGKTFGVSSVGCSQNFPEISSLQFPAGHMQLLGWGHLCSTCQCRHL
jgi:hypothetical protein